MTSKQRDTMLFNMDSQLHTAVAASSRACERAKTAVENTCGKVLSNVMRGKKNGRA